MGIRKGLFVGFIAGSAIAALVASARRAEAPGEAGEGPAGEGATAGEANPLKETLEFVKRRAEEALDAAHEAQEEKEAELRRRFDEIRRGQG